MIKHIFAFSLCFLAFSAFSQYTGGRLQNVRFNASIGIFSAGGVGDYQGAIGVIGSTGYTVDSIQAGDLLLDDANLYRIDAISVDVPGSVATIDVTFLQGTVGGPAPPQSGRGMVVRGTSNLGLLLLTENGSNFITEEQEAKALTHNFLVIDQLLGQVSQGPDTSLQSFDLVIPENRTVEGPDTNYSRTILWRYLDQLFDTKVLELGAKDSLRLKTPGIHAGTRVNGMMLTLIDANTGQAEWDDIGKYLPEDTNTDSLIVKGPDSTYQVNRLDTIYVPSGPRRYDAGNGCWIYATGPGASYVKSAGQGTITVPEGVELFSYRIVGGSSDLNSGELRITVVYPPGVSFNQSDATLWHPDITVQNRTTVLPSDPFQQRPDDAGDSINIFDEKFSSAGQVTTQITGLSGDWGVKGTF